MNNAFSTFLVYFLGASCLFFLIATFLKKDKAFIWSPLTFFTITVFYYCVLPEFTTSRIFEGMNTSSFGLSFHLAALLSYLSILFGFFFLWPNSPTNWKRWNNTFTEGNASTIAIILFVFALLCYIPFRGFNFSIFTSSDELNEIDWDSQGFASYFVGTISLFVTSCCLFLVGIRKGKNKILFIVAIWLTLLVYIISGFRYRIIILLIALFSTYYLYFSTKSIKVVPILLIALVCYFGFNYMDRTRSYGSGIQLDVAKRMSNQELTHQAGETERVYNFSILVMDTYESTGRREYFAPIVNAICMPIPRAIFPSKPNAEYMYEATSFVMRGWSGSAYVNSVEAFMAFGWLGVILNGLFLGWLARRFWNNYKKSPRSIGSILALALFNGVTYVIVSRGYLAQEFNIALYFICLPFWLSQLYNFLIRKKAL